MLDSSNKYNWSTICKASSLCELFCPAVLSHCMVQRSREIILGYLNHKVQSHHLGTGCQDPEDKVVQRYPPSVCNSGGLTSRNPYALVPCIFSKVGTWSLEKESNNSLNLVTTRNSLLSPQPLSSNSLHSFLITHTFKNHLILAIKTNFQVLFFVLNSSGLNQIFNLTFSSNCFCPHGSDWLTAWGLANGEGDEICFSLLPFFHCSRFPGSVVGQEWRSWQGLK